MPFVPPLSLLSFLLFVSFFAQKSCFIMMTGTSASSTDLFVEACPGFLAGCLRERRIERTTDRKQKCRKEAARGMAAAAATATAHNEPKRPICFGLLYILFEEKSIQRAVSEFPHAGEGQCRIMAKCRRAFARDTISRHMFASRFGGVAEGRKERSGIERSSDSASLEEEGGEEGTPDPASRHVGETPAVQSKVSDGVGKYRNAAAVDAKEYRNSFASVVQLDSRGK